MMLVNPGPPRPEKKELVLNKILSTREFL